MIRLSATTMTAPSSSNSSTSLPKQLRPPPLPQDLQHLPVLPPMAGALHGWHAGERTVHERVNDLHDGFRAIEGELSPDHARFHSSCLPFVPLTTLDKHGRPWGSLLAGAGGRLGFVTAPRRSVLSIEAEVWPGEPLLETAGVCGPKGEVLAAGIGVDFGTRERNKFAGKVTRLEQRGEKFSLDITVNEAIRNCPKYVTARDLIPHPDTLPTISVQKQYLSPYERLPDEIISFILSSDTVFLGTTYRAPQADAQLYPSHLGMNQRGGRAGFIRVSPSDGRTIVLPDFSGNRLMTSLGNIEATPLASLTFVSFTTGDILYMTGTAHNLYGRDARKLMPFQNMLTAIQATGYTLVLDALPIRQRPHTLPRPSPYNPPLRHLASEAPQARQFDDGDKLPAQLVHIAMHSPIIATFTWETPAPLALAPGQAVIMDFVPLLGAKKYRHMAPHNPQSVNDDRVRTWSVSARAGRTFCTTMREKQGGIVTGALFSIARKLAEVKPGMLDDSRPLGLGVVVVGVTGEFVLERMSSAPRGITVPEDGRSNIFNLPPALIQAPRTKKQALWVAGGIGVTPFLALFRGLADSLDEWEVNFVLSTRRPDVLLPLISAALQHGWERRRARIRMDVFSDRPIPVLEGVLGAVVLRRHTGRVAPAFFEGLEWQREREVGADRGVYVCGPEPFEKVVVDALLGMGVRQSEIHREGFAY